LLERPAKEYFRVLLGQVVSLQHSIWLIPLVNPIDHAQQRESRGTRSYISFRLAKALDFRNEVLNEVDVILLAGIDFFAQRGWQRVVFMQHHGNLAVGRA